MMNNKGQEEMVGFGLIIVIVGVILLVFLSFTFGNKDTSVQDSYEIESFIQASMQYTSDCQSNLELLPIRSLIVSCNDGNSCVDGRRACEVLNSTLIQMVDESWNVGNGSYIKGFYMNITSPDKTILEIKQGTNTSIYQTSVQPLREQIEMQLEIFY